MSTYIFDTETTGTNEPHIVEAAWIKLSNTGSLAPQETFCQRYNPDKKIDLGALATHHILDEELVGMPLHSEFKLPDDAEYIIGHNIDFDWKVIGEPSVKRICTLALSRHFFPALDSHNQSAMLYYFLKVDARPLLQKAHSAAQDVTNCRLVLFHLLEVIFKDKGYTYEELWQVSEKARIPTIMTFGKHKGTLIKDIPGDYKQWLLKQPDIDPYLTKALKAA